MSLKEKVISDNEPSFGVLKALGKDDGEHDFEFYLLADTGRAVPLMNHLPLALVSAHLLGGKPKNFEELFSFYPTTLRRDFEAALISPQPDKQDDNSIDFSSEANWKEWIGKPGILNRTRQYFLQQIEAKGIKSAVKTFLPTLAQGSLASLFHGQIAIGYSLELALRPELFTSSHEEYTRVTNKQLARALSVFTARSFDFGELPNRLPTTRSTTHNPKDLTFEGFKQRMKAASESEAWESVWKKVTEGIDDTPDLFVVLKKIQKQTYWEEFFRDFLDIDIENQKLEIGNVLQNLSFLMSGLAELLFHEFIAQHCFIILHILSAIRALETTFRILLDSNKVDEDDLKGVSDIYRGAWRHFSLVLLLLPRVKGDLTHSQRAQSKIERLEDTWLSKEKYQQSWDALSQEAIETKMLHTIKLTWVARALSLEHPELDELARRSACIAIGYQIL